MRIAIDARAISHPQSGGFKSYTTNLVRALLAHDRENEYLLYLDRPLPSGELRELNNTSHRVIRSVRGWASVPVREQILLPSLVARQRPSVVHFPCGTGPIAPTRGLVVTIHDAIELLGRSPAPGALARGFRHWLMGQYSRCVQKRLARQAEAIITVSHHAKRDLAMMLEVPSEKIHVIHNAHAEHFRPVRDLARLTQMRDRYRLPPSFVLTLASASQRKNLAGLLRAYGRLPASLRERFPLIVIWTHPLLQQRTMHQVQSLGLDGCVHFLRDVPDEDLVLLYNAATAFIFPSLYEGFGLPVLEAMACGTPVIASSLTSVPEVAADGAKLVDPRDEHAFAQALEETLTDANERASLSHAALSRARQFSWERASRMTLDVYREVGVGR